MSPAAFFQVNTQAAEVLQAEIQRLCGLTDAKDTNLLDICCGTGTIGLALAHVCKKVIGIEMCTAAVDDARANAELNGITNTKYYATKVEAVIQEILRSLPKGEPVVGVLDPPRCGLRKWFLHSRFARPAWLPEHYLGFSLSREPFHVAQ